jgi:hypothetical protein
MRQESVGQKADAISQRDAIDIKKYQLIVLRHRRCAVARRRERQAIGFEPINPNWKTGDGIGTGSSLI